MTSSPKSRKERADVLVVERGLAPSRSKAQALILAGTVLAGDVPIEKPGQLISTEVSLRVRGQDHPYVSRGALKLNRALDEFGIDVGGRIGLDIGASTGGFTEVLLLRGAVRVHAIDVGSNQLDWKLRNDPRVISKEGVNAREMTFEAVGEKADVIVMDVSFISVTKILPALLAFSGSDTDWITLIKPQFEVGRDKVGKGGIVRSEEDRERAVRHVIEFAESLGLEKRGLIESPIKGAQGNKEFLVHWKEECD